MHDKKFTAVEIQSEVLGDELAQNVISDIGYEHYPEQVQAEMISEIGEVLMMRLSLEIVKQLPQDKADDFEKLIGGGNMQAIRDLVEPYIPNFDRFIQETVSKEYASLKQKLAAAQEEEDKKKKPFSYV
jgi:hypothetical protein